MVSPVVMLVMTLYKSLAVSQRVMEKMAASAWHCSSCMFMHHHASPWTRACARI